MLRYSMDLRTRALADCDAGHANPVASQRIPSLLAVEVEGAQPSTATAGRPATDCRHGSCERDVRSGLPRNCASSLAFACRH